MRNSRGSSITMTKGTAQISQYVYTRDAKGNILSTNFTGVLASQPSFGSHTLTLDPEGKLISRNTDQFSYDADGNMTLKTVNGESTSIAYDELNKMVSYGADSYAYDAEGNLVSSNVGGTARNYTIAAGLGLPQVLEEYDGSGAVVARYVYGLGLISREDASGNVSFYHYDSRGSTVGLSDSTGKITDSYGYDPYGKLTSKTGVTQNPFTFVGRYGIMAQSNGLYYMRARFYDPDLKRFLNKDPLLGSIHDASFRSRNQ